jgi:hypothetical protein
MSRKHRAPTRPESRPARAGPGAPALWDEPETPAAADSPLDAADPDEEDDEETPKVVVAMLRDLSPWIPASATEGQPDRVAWFLPKRDADLVGVFERYPEASLSPSAARPILQGLREFCLDQSESLQLYVGVTEGIEYGFHVDASLEQIVESFEDDGFEVIDAIRGGRVVVEEPAEPPVER